MRALLSSSPTSSSSLAATGFASSPQRRRSSSSPSILGVASISKGLASSKWVSSFMPSSGRSAPACRTLVTPSVLCKVPNITQDRFSDEVLKSDSPVLVGFCADWCGPCKLIGPVIDSVAKDFHGSLKAVKVDVDTSPDLVKEYDVYGLPTLILFKDGKEVPKSRKEGAINAKKLKALLDEVLPTIARS